MKKHYDFSKGEKRKFYVPESEIELPVYLNSNNQEYFLKIATEKKITYSKLINNLLSKEKDIVNILASK
jgi:hypothetical protein